MNSKKKWGQRGEWYVVIQIILFALIYVAPRLLPPLITWQNPWNRMGVIVGVVLGLIGVLIAGVGLLSLGRNATAVPYPKDDAVLVERGAYRLVRHPIYSGIIFAAFGYGLLNNSLLTLALAFLLFIFFDVKSRREELWLSEKFATYTAYQARVRKLIPFIY